MRDVEAVGSNPVTSTIPHSDDGDKYAGVVKLADTPDLGSGVYDVGVQVPSPAPKNPSLVTWIFLSIAKQWYIITARSAVHIISPFGAVSHHASACIFSSQ